MTKYSVPFYRYILDALDHIREYQPPTLSDFSSDSKSRDAMMMRLQEVGENLARIRTLNEERFRTETPDSWKKLISLRHVISHEYENIRFDVIWNIVTEELDPFGQSVRDALAHDLEREKEALD